MDLNLDYEQLFMWELWASVPSFLYRKFKEEQCVIELSKNFTSNELIEEYNHLLSLEYLIDENEDGEILIKHRLDLYTLLITLTLKNENENDKESKNFLLNVKNNNHIRWVEDIRDLWIRDNWC